MSSLTRIKISSRRVCARGSRVTASTTCFSRSLFLTFPSPTTRPILLGATHCAQRHTLMAGAPRIATSSSSRTRKSLPPHQRKRHTLFQRHKKDTHARRPSSHSLARRPAMGTKGSPGFANQICNLPRERYAENLSFACAKTAVPAWYPPGENQPTLSHIVPVVSLAPCGHPFPLEGVPHGWEATRVTITTARHQDLSLTLRDSPTIACHFQFFHPSSSLARFLSFWQERNHRCYTGALTTPNLHSRIFFVKRTGRAHAAAVYRLKQ